MPLLILCICIYSLFIISTHSMAFLGVGIYPEWYMSDKYAHLLLVIYCAYIFLWLYQKEINGNNSFGTTTDSSRHRILSG